MGEGAALGRRRGRPPADSGRHRTGQEEVGTSRILSLPAANAKRLRKGALATKQSICRLLRHGLLRCARNDGEAPRQLTPPASATRESRTPPATYSPTGTPPSSARRRPAPA